LASSIYRSLPVVSALRPGLHSVVTAESARYHVNYPDLMTPSMSALLLLAICLALGMITVRYANPPVGLVPSLNWWVIQIALPALVLELIPRVHFNADLWFLVVTQWLVFVGALILFHCLGQLLGWSRGRIGALVLVCGLGNTSFVGYPMLEALRGADGLALGVVADQLGCFIMLSLGGVLVAVIYGEGSAHPAVIAKKVLLFPAFIALLIGAAVGYFGGWPKEADDILHRIGQTLSPLALFSVGLRLKLSLHRQHWLPVFLGLGWKLALIPALTLGLGLACGIHGLLLSVAVLQTAMAPMISAAILADQHDLEPELANAVLGIGIVLSLFTVPLWNIVLP